MPFAPSAQLHPVGLDLPSLDNDDADSADDSDLDVRLSSRIRSTARAQAAHTSAGFTAGSHLEAAYESDDEDPDSVARRKRRLGRSYITSESRARGEALRERRNRLAEMLAAEEDACAAAESEDADGDDDDEGMMDVDDGADGSSRRNRPRSDHPHAAARPARKRRFFRESRFDLATLLKPPASARPAGGLPPGLQPPYGFGFGLGGGGGVGGGGGYAASDVASISQFGGGGGGGANGITREWTEGLQA